MNIKVEPPINHIGDKGKVEPPATFSNYKIAEVSFISTKKMRSKKEMPPTITVNFGDGSVSMEPLPYWLKRVKIEFRYKE